MDLKIIHSYNTELNIWKWPTPLCSVVATNLTLRLSTRLDFSLFLPPNQENKIFLFWYKQFFPFNFWTVFFLLVYFLSILNAFYQSHILFISHFFSVSFSHFIFFSNYITSSGCVGVCVCSCMHILFWKDFICAAKTPAILPFSSSTFMCVTSPFVLSSFNIYCLKILHCVILPPNSFH